LIGRRYLSLMPGSRNVARPAYFWLQVQMPACAKKGGKMGKPGGNGSRPLLHILSFAEITGQRQKKREDEQVGWQLFPTTIAHPIPRRMYQPALKIAGGKMGKSGGN
jgi:hypothetical protein